MSCLWTACRTHGLRHVAHFGRPCLEAGNAHCKASVHLTAHAMRACSRGTQTGWSQYAGGKGGGGQAYILLEHAAKATVTCERSYNFLDPSGSVSVSSPPWNTMNGNVYLYMALRPASAARRYSCATLALVAPCQHSGSDMHNKRGVTQAGRSSRSSFKNQMQGIRHASRIGGAEKLAMHAAGQQCPRGMHPLQCNCYAQPVLRPESSAPSSQSACSSGCWSFFVVEAAGNVGQM